MIEFKDKDEERTWTSIVIAAINHGGFYGPALFAEADLILEQRRKRGSSESSATWAQPSSDGAIGPTGRRPTDGDGKP
jgi:hypothetical protein